MPDVVRRLWRLVLTLLLLGTSAQAVPLEGKLVVVGSDTLAEIMTLWSAGFSALYPSVSVELQAGGSAAAPPALIRGTANVGSMSRRMTAAEKARFVAERGFEPLEIPLAIDTIAIIVHRDNPLHELDLATVARIFGDGACGVRAPLRRWDQLGLGDNWQGRHIEAYGRTAASGTYEFFRSRALCGGDPSPHVGESQGNAAIVDTVATIPGAMGYVGIGFVDSRVRVPALRLENEEVISFSAMASHAEYPLQRTLYLYLPLSSDRDLPALECEFLRYIQSGDGTRLLRDAGFMPIKDDSFPQMIRGCAL